VFRSGFPFLFGAHIKRSFVRWRAIGRLGQLPARKGTRKSEGRWHRRQGRRGGRGCRNHWSVSRPPPQGTCVCADGRLGRAREPY
jgi:hypothetical protein